VVPPEREKNGPQGRGYRDLDAFNASTQLGGSSCVEVLVPSTCSYCLGAWHKRLYISRMGLSELMIF
jgi:hypothetical protein